MASFGTPHEGVAYLIAPQYSASGLKLVLYTNTGNSLDRDTVLADLTAPDNAAEGYAEIDLDQTWSVDTSEISYVHTAGTNPTFTNTGTGASWDTCTGSAITDGTYILHFKDFGTPITLTVGATLAIDISSITP